MSQLIELDDLLESAPAAASPAEVEDIVQRRFGMSGRMQMLSSERDANFRIDTSAGPYLIKITNSAEDPDVTDMQTAALRHLERDSPSLPVPRIIATLDGADQAREILRDKTHIVRLMSFMPGRPLASMPASSKIRSALGVSLGQLDAGLSKFNHPASGHSLLWNAADALRVRGAIRFVSDAKKRQLAETTLDEYERFATPIIPKLRRQIIHNDFNPHNVLFDNAVLPSISGIIDFGDILKAPLVSEVSTALAYQDYRSTTPLKVVSDVIQAYHRYMPLVPQELDIVLDFVRARQVLVGVISAWRAASQPTNSSYILRNSAHAWNGLEALHSVSRDQFRRSLTQACGETT